jgi:hypothetical protein
LAEVGESGGARAADLGNKLSYLFGQGGGNEHNVERSVALYKQLQRIGISDTEANREYVREHLIQVLQNPSSLREIAKSGREIRESLLMGPLGGTKLETIWEGDKLITIFASGGRKGQ